MRFLHKIKKLADPRLPESMKRHAHRILRLHDGLISQDERTRPRQAATPAPQGLGAR